MDTFEGAFNEVERAADAVLQILAEQSKLVRQLKKAAHDGNIVAIKRFAERLPSGADTVGQAAVNAAQAWPFTEESEREYLQKSYARELQVVAEAKGLAVFERDGRLIAHPSIVRVVPGDRALMVNRKRSSNIRPSRVVEGLEKLQKTPPKFNPQQFLETLHTVYVALTRDTAGRDDDRFNLPYASSVVRLSVVYDMVTALPGQSREYSQLDFARDLYALESSGVTHTKSGARVAFPASTSIRLGRNILSFIGPSGDQVHYYGIQFTGD